MTVWQEGRALGYRVSPVGPLGVAESLWRIEPHGTKASRVELRLDCDLCFGALGALVHALMVRRLLVGNLPGALRLLKRRVETGRTEGIRRPSAAG